MTHFKYVHRTKNAKVGAIPATYSSSDTCPPTCKLKKDGACYGKTGPVSWTWAKLDKGEGAIDFAQLLSKIEALPEGQLWRHNVVGDLLVNPNSKGMGMLSQTNLSISTAASGTRGYTYTHATVLGEGFNERINRGTIEKMNKMGGLVVNLSADTLEEADQKAALGIAPVTVTVSEHYPRQSETPEGRPVRVCPAQYVSGMTCVTCGVCQVRDRHTIIAFRAHGARKGKLTERLIPTENV